MSSSEFPNSPAQRRFTLAQLLLAIALVGLVIATVPRMMQRHTWEGVGAIAFSPEGDFVAAGITQWTWEPYRFIPQKTDVEIWNTSIEDEPVTVSVRGPVRAIAFSPDSRDLAVALRGSSIQVLRRGDNGTSKPFSVDVFACRLLSYGSTNKTLFAGGSGQIRVFDLPSGNERVYDIDMWKRHADGSSEPLVELDAIAVSSDESLFATGGDGIAHVWEAGTGRKVFTVDPLSGKVVHLQFENNEHLYALTQDESLSLSYWKLNGEAATCESRETYSSLDARKIWPSTLSSSQSLKGEYTFDIIARNGQSRATVSSSEIKLWNLKVKNATRILHVKQTKEPVPWLFYLLGFAVWGIAWWKVKRASGVMNLPTQSRV